jgi:signal transduction histidine kinase
MAFVIALFGLLLVALARDAFRLFRQSYEIRLQHVELNKQLKTALDEGEAIRLQQLGLNAQLEAALDQAEAASRAKTRFLASASHDLRQPMHTLSLFGAALALRPLDGRSREIAQHMNTALQTLTSQMDALLDISKLDAGVVPVNRTRIQLSSFLKRIDPEFATAARAKGLRWRVRCPLGIFIETDEFLFERVIRNLLDNAIKYTRSGHVSVSAVAASHGVVLRISDSGRGIATEDQQQVFEEFFQGENPERDRTRGLGLGLAIVRRLENLLQIKIGMESAPGRGTTFCIALPLASSAAITVAPSAPAPLGTKHILIIDDETMVQLGMQTLLEEMGCSASLADGTANAVAAARAIKPDVVVADLRLRGTDSGIAAVDAIRKVYPKMPAIFISGETAPEKLREAEGTGIMLLHKPVAIEILRKAIGDVCNG